MKLKNIPSNTVVHTPTEAKAKELLAILHENGYDFKPTYEELLTNCRHYSDSSVLCFLFDDNRRIGHCYRSYFEREEYTILTLAEFKERYCEEEKPQPKFKVGDKVRISGNCGCNAKGVVGTVERVGERGLHVETAICRLFVAFDEIEPYTEPETKPTEDMETKELNLCELLKGHEDEVFYSPIYGEVTIEFNKESGVMEMWPLSKRAYLPIAPNGHLTDNPEKGQCLIFPSRALYEQYPLDPYTAWMKWQEEQKKYALSIAYVGNGIEAENVVMTFFKDADRDKCIEEIKAIIEKYSKQ